ncbi:hypothetical protein RchiOBHm_Chr7g0228931 [Rosa chinensis]|uniref:Uncharacterized protein n=1 Tax=Rosa chinensis TaxID=74649 RepID=A0A2P6PEZ8_ROSCH|nr:hypothetical protein RchiOBHm_Chr7g0228931 [Rosa chinensis]
MLHEGMACISFSTVQWKLKQLFRISNLLFCQITSISLLAELFSFPYHT